MVQSLGDDAEIQRVVIGQRTLMDCFLSVKFFRNISMATSGDCCGIAHDDRPQNTTLGASGKWLSSYVERVGSPSYRY